MNNVVKMWRQRGLLLSRQAWMCKTCEHMTLVRRRLCPACGTSTSFERAPLPKRGTVMAATSAGAAIEHLDQVSDRKDAVLVGFGSGMRIACLLAQSDASLLPALRDQPVRIAVRRLSLGEVPTDHPIAYGIKAAVDIETRKAIQSQQDGKENG